MELQGLFTRFGAELSNFQGFGHCQSDPETEYDGQARWYWFFTADLSGKEDDGTDYEMLSRRVFMDQVVHDSDDEAARQNMAVLSKACMDYLNVNGTWHDKGRAWLPNGYDHCDDTD